MQMELAQPRPSAQTLRPYQEGGLLALRKKAQDGIRKLLLVLPTGGGKTTIAAKVIDNAIERKQRVIFLAHRKELIDQCSKRLDGQGINHGVIMAQHPRRMPWLPVQVASVATLRNRLEDGKAHLYIIDEAHRAKAKSYKMILDSNPQARVLGLTATPWRLDGQGLGDIFEDIVVASTPTELRDLGYLTPISGFAFDAPDLSKVSRTAGDFKEDELGRKMSTKSLMGNIAHQYQAHAYGKRAVVFAVHVEHSKQVVEQFRSLSIPAEHLDGTTPRLEREGILARLKSGETLVVSNVGVLTEGWDCPEIEVGILARPTTSVALYLQMVGRTLRPVCFDCGRDCDARAVLCSRCGSANIKREARLHDHAGMVAMHGLPFEERDYSLTLTPNGSSRRTILPLSDQVRTCLAILADGSACLRMYAAIEPACPSCGHVNSKRLVVVKTIDKVQPKTLEEAAMAYRLSKEQLRGEYMKLVDYADTMGYKKHWATVKFKARFKVWPEFLWMRKAGAV